MAELAGELWKFNMAKVVVVDVTEDYRLMQPPLPSEFYPVVAELWMPAYRLRTKLWCEHLVDGFLYDWHQGPECEPGEWYVGVVQESFVHEMCA